MDNNYSDEKFPDDAVVMWSGTKFPRVIRGEKHPERLMVVFSHSTGGCLKMQGENLICFTHPETDFYLPWIRDFKKIVLVHEVGSEQILTMLALLRRMNKNKEFFRGKLFLLIPRGQLPIGVRSSYEIREEELIPIDADELDLVSDLPHFVNLALYFTPYAQDYCPAFAFRDLQSWTMALLKNALSELSRNRLFPQLRNGLLETQRLMMRNKSHIGGFEVVLRSGDFFSAEKGLFRHCIVPSDDTRQSTPRNFPRSVVNCFSAIRYDGPAWLRWWFHRTPLNDLGRDLMPHPDSKRPAIFPRAEWAEKGWKFILDEWRPLFPLLLWEGHHVNVGSLECFIPPYNFHELIRAMKDVLMGLPQSDLFPDIEGEKWVDVTFFRDGRGMIALEGPCKTYRFEPNDRVFRVELTSTRGIDKLFWNIERPCGCIYRTEKESKTIWIEPDSEESRSYIAKVLENALTPQILSAWQVLWDGDRYRPFKTSELVRHYANSIAETFDGSRDCAIRYLDLLDRKYSGSFLRKTRIIRQQLSK